MFNHPSDNPGGGHRDIHAELLHDIHILGVIDPRHRLRNVKLLLCKLAGDQVILILASYGDQRITLPRAAARERFHHGSIPADHGNIEQICNAPAVFLLLFNQADAIAILHQRLREEIAKITPADDQYFPHDSIDFLSRPLFCEKRPQILQKTRLKGPLIIDLRKNHAVAFRKD